jgi:hypothetical protein
MEPETSSRQPTTVFDDWSIIVSGFAKGVRIGGSGSGSDCTICN